MLNNWFHSWQYAQTLQELWSSRNVYYQRNEQILCNRLLLLWDPLCWLCSHSCSVEGFTSSDPSAILSFFSMPRSSMRFRIHSERISSNVGSTEFLFAVSLLPAWSRLSAIELVVISAFWRIQIYWWSSCRPLFWNCLGCVTFHLLIRSLRYGYRSFQHSLEIGTARNTRLVVFRGCPLLRESFLERLSSS